MNTIPDVVRFLRLARDEARAARAPKLLRRIRAALASAGGAARHAALAQERAARRKAREDARTCAECGTIPPARSDCVGRFARDRRGRSICVPCAERAELRAFLRADRYCGYLSGDGARFTTWAGAELARIVRETTGRNGGAFGSFWSSRNPDRWHGARRTYFRAVDSLGREWYGTSPGRGMYARARLCKRSKRKGIPAPTSAPSSCAAPVAPMK